ncbi:unnamed protein product [Lactuca virosa]|uniref:Uncharacterized protein n=1 Tax=Lactuca virosa TaxID=75947 RepID=A0AAU9PJB0_9ASTR|nr:unnamed protein product [Lactuca virosa]
MPRETTPTMCHNTIPSLDLSVLKECMSLAAFFHFLLNQQQHTLFHSTLSLSTKQPRSSNSSTRKMGKGKGSSLVHLLVIILCLVAFGFAIAAVALYFLFLSSKFELFMLISSGTIRTDNATNSTYCVYDSDIATGYGVGAFLFLLSGESLLMGVTKCMCFGSPLAPGGNRAWTIIYFTFSLLSFVVAEACLIAGVKKNAYHTKYKGMTESFSCDTLRKGVLVCL